YSYVCFNLQYLNRGDTELFEVIDGRWSAERRISASQLLWDIGPKFAEAFHVQFINHRIVQRDPGSLVALPVKSGVDHHRLRHAPCVITKVLSQIFLLITDHVSEHLICPTYFSSDSLCLAVEKEFGTVKTQPALWIVRTGNAKTVELAGARIGQKLMPHLISLFCNRDTNVLFGVLD